MKKETENKAKMLLESRSARAEATCPTSQPPPLLGGGPHVPAPLLPPLQVGFAGSKAQSASTLQPAHVSVAVSQTGFGFLHCACVVQPTQVSLVVSQTSPAEHCASTVQSTH